MDVLKQTCVTNCLFMLLGLVHFRSNISW